MPLKLVHKCIDVITSTMADGADSMRGVQCRQEVAGHISWLQRKREMDPYKDFLPRIAYETSWGGKQAPTFKL